MVAHKIILLLIIIILFYNAFTLSLLSAIIIVLGIILGFFFREVYLYLGLSILSLEFLSVILVFLFGLVRGEKNILKNALLFFIPFLFLLVAFPLEYTELGTAAALLAILFSKQ